MATHSFETVGPEATISPVSVALRPCQECGSTGGCEHLVGVVTIAGQEAPFPVRVVGGSIHDAQRRVAEALVQIAAVVSVSRTGSDVRGSTAVLGNLYIAASAGSTPARSSSPKKGASNRGCRSTLIRGLGVLQTEPAVKANEPV